MNLRRCTMALLAGLVAAGTSCRHAIPVNQGKGAASFTVLEPPPTIAAPSTDQNVTGAPGSGAQYREATLGARPVLPIYPPRALIAQAGAARIGVHLTIDTHGQVAAVTASMRAITIAPPAFAEEFYRAVETAVRQWQFRPAAIDYVETVHEGGVTFERLKRSEAQVTELDLVFAFTEQGTVQAGK